MPEEYNPLDYENLTRNCVQELMTRGPFTLPVDRFSGSGVYALFYTGELEFYAPLRSLDAVVPIYVGKAVPPGARKGLATAGGSFSLFGRLAEHFRSIESASNLQSSEFLCRYLAVTPLWITMAERFLIEHYRPLWNVWIDGFGNHPPGRGRPAGEISWWDALHPGREWAMLLRQTRSQEQAIERVRAYYGRPREVRQATETVLQADERSE
jgi:Eco29kI-like restriction endonuclease